MTTNKKYQHLFFDLDNTITRSRSPITDEMRVRIMSMPEDIVVISGAAVPQMEQQLGDIEAYLLGQNGNHAVYKGKELWNDALTESDVAEIERHIESLQRDWEVPDENDLVEYRGCQLSYSIYGHHAPYEEKEAFDPDQKKRRALLAASPLHSSNIEVKIAGTTTLDYFKKGMNKGANITRLIDELGWDKHDCVYIGDALFPGGNDESVVGVIETRAVNNPDDTYALLTRISM